MGLWLAMGTADGTERVFAIDKPRLVIGRISRCDVRIPLPSVADRHCEIVICQGRLKVRDLGSTLGTYVNGERVHEINLRKRDHISLGPVTFTLCNGKDVPANGMLGK